MNYLKARSDDSEKTIKNRIEIYTNKTLPILDYYEDQKILYKIDATGEINKIYEELEELKLGIKNNNQKNIDEELGDILIGVVNLSRFLHVSAEVAMQKSNKKFYKRFTTMEKFITKDKKEIDKLSLAELDIYWEKVKDEE